MRTNHFFLACHSTCAECSGSLSTQCTKCDPPTTLSAGVCQPCPDGSFYSSVTSNCQGKFFPAILVINVSLACDSTCAKCIGTSTNCTACNAPKYLEAGQCKSCLNAQYYISATQTCGGKLVSL